MQGLFEGLYLYEITLLILGAILFLVLIILLVVKVATRQPINVLISFFILPIFMIGFPGIQQFRFMNGLADLKMKTNQAIEEPENHELLAEIGDDLTNITKRPVSTPENLLVLGEAYEVLDRTEEARRIAYNIRERQPENDAAIQLQQRIELSEIISRVQENPQDERTRNELQSNITLFEAVPERDARSLLSIARAYMALGDTTKAEVYADSVNVVRPQMDARARLQTDFRRPNR